ncbi:MAG: alpha/beta hydrolase [Acidimicrobiaceae bacterium]|nr:alpha/beta hydrolase [Acidimicrobiaceae bacterium]
MAHGEVPQPHDALHVAAADGVTLSVRRHGSPVSPCRVLMSHGIGLAANAYFPFWSQFTERFDVVVYDMRCHGHSDVGPLDTLNVPTLVDDSRLVLKAVQRAWGTKPTVGVLHSLGAVVGLLHAVQEADFAGLVLFDPPVWPTDGMPGDMEARVQRTAKMARRRRDRFEHPGQLAEALAGAPPFRLVPRSTLELIACSTLVEEGDEWRLRCPPAHEARLAEWTFGFTMQLPDVIGSLPIPVKVIGADPTVPFSFLPTIDMSDLITIGYDFVPDHSHFLQFENPTLTSSLVADFLESLELA